MNKSKSLTIRHATIEEKRKVYEWLCCSDTTGLHLGEPNYPECPVPTWEEFLEEFQDFYFLESGRNKASIMIIENNSTEIGCVCYKMFYLKNNRAELSIWLNSKKFLGYGLGRQALRLVMRYLQKNYSVKQFILRPSVKNVAAINVYKKLGFKIVPEKDKYRVINDFIKPEFIKSCIDGDYGFDNSAIMVKKTNK
ncbi:MAG: GNAT family N-acetyltransferase [Endomicrobiia bacterium]